MTLEDSLVCQSPVAGKEIEAMGQSKEVAMGFFMKTDKDW